MVVSSGSLCPAGYKQTEVGIIPEEWRVVTLGSVCNFENGDRSSNYPSPGSFVESGIPFINAGHVAEGKIDSSQMDYITPESYRRIGGGKVIPGDILFCLRGSLGKYGIVSQDFGEGAIASSLIIVRPKSKSLTRDFLSCYFSSSLCQRMIDTWAGGAAQPNLGGQDLARFLFAQPATTSEQHAITEVLSDVDGLLGGLDRLIAKKRDLKQAAMQQLLTGQTRLPGFHGEWVVKRLGDVASVSKGTQLHSSETDVGGKFAHLNGGITPSSYTHKSNTDGNTIAISEGGNSCGFVQFMTEPYWCGGHCYSVIPNGVDNLFLYHALKGQQSAIMGLRVGSGLPNVQKTGLLDFKIHLPATHPEQTAIAEVLTDMDAELTALEQRREKTYGLKQGMMQELLTGRTRLV